MTDIGNGNFEHFETFIHGLLRGGLVAGHDFSPQWPGRLCEKSPEMLEKTQRQREML